MFSEIRNQTSSASTWEALRTWHDTDETLALSLIVRPVAKQPAGRLGRRNTPDMHIHTVRLRSFCVFVAPSRAHDTKLVKQNYNFISVYDWVSRTTIHPSFFYKRIRSIPSSLEPTLQSMSNVSPSIGKKGCSSAFHELGRSLWVAIEPLAPSLVRFSFLLGNVKRQV